MSNSAFKMNGLSLGHKGTTPGVPLQCLHWFEPGAIVFVAALQDIACCPHHLNGANAISCNAATKGQHCIEAPLSAI